MKKFESLKLKKFQLDEKVLFTVVGGINGSETTVVTTVYTTDNDRETSTKTINSDGCPCPTK
ncbi:MAG: hypothetical protein HYR91_10485 [Flavobacteriia bacterium]|nr:hypothetical protein [Flavobacteriia bacterium]